MKENNDMIDPYTVVQCPNMCFSGQVRHYSDKNKALFHMKTCPYCKGKGEVSKVEAKKILAVL